MRKLVGRVMFGLIVLALMGSCTTAQKAETPKADTAAITAAVDSINKAFAAAIAARDTESVVSFYAGQPARQRQGWDPRRLGRVPEDSRPLAHAPERQGAELRCRRSRRGCRELHHEGEGTEGPDRGCREVRDGLQEDRRRLEDRGRHLQQRQARPGGVGRRPGNAEGGEPGSSGLVQGPRASRSTAVGRCPRGSSA